MVLSNDRIKGLIGDEKLYIGQDARLKYPITEMKFDTTALDVHLASEFKTWKETLPGEESIFDPSVSDFELEEMAKMYVKDGHLEEDGSFILRPRKFVLAKTVEYLKLPNNLSARIEGRSKLGRLGVGIHVTAPTVHALWEGTLALEIYNHSPRAVKLVPWKSLKEPGLRIGQLIFEEVSGDVAVNSSATFIGQTNSLGGRK